MRQPFAHEAVLTMEVDGEIHLRTLFVVEPEREDEVRERIRAALTAGALVGPDDRESRWELRASDAAPVRPDEMDHARRLAGG